MSFSVETGKSKGIPTVAIVGRTNVGKSSLFNALVRKSVAIVEDYPGVTRDRRYGVVQEEYGIYRLVDTGGFLGEDDNPLQHSVRQQAELAIAESHLVIVVFDGMQGPSPLDSEMVEIIRKSKKEVLWVVNKCEKPENQGAAVEFYQLGIEEVIPLSAAHRWGVSELRGRIREALGLDDANRWSQPLAEVEASEDGVEDEEAENSADPKLIKVALVGRPNVGKSSLLNRILGEERVITADIAGTTRDSVDALITRDGQQFEFVDTAGLRKKARVEDGTVERYSNIRSLKALAKADVTILVLDATQDLGGQQDTRLAGLAHERGRGLIIVVNKWDAVEKDHKTVLAYKEYIEENFKFAKYAPILFVSALTGRRCPSIISTIKDVYRSSTLRVSTPEVNRVLKKAFSDRPPPIHRGSPLKMMFATQIGTLPPTFVLFMNHISKIHFGYERYLKNVLRKEFGFEGVDIKIHFRKRRGKADPEKEYYRESA